ncbi:MAG: hypothetical protein IKU37_08790 [Candidatus Gastranaerophilales bacterium]|nr:hypothetical protein [Candidatus Gastranaerophilales bacterium]
MKLTKGQYMTAGRPRIYKDDILVTRALRVSEKYELKYVVAFIEILRKYRGQAIAFVEKYMNKTIKKQEEQQ